MFLEYLKQCTIIFLSLNALPTSFEKKRTAYVFLTFSSFLEVFTNGDLRPGFLTALTSTRIQWAHSKVHDITSPTTLQCLLTFIIFKVSSATLLWFNGLLMIFIFQIKRGSLHLHQAARILSQGRTVEIFSETIDFWQLL